MRNFVWPIVLLFLASCASSPAYATNCKFDWSSPINMPSKSMWYHPTLPYKEVSCEEIQRVLWKNELMTKKAAISFTQGCHVLGLTLKSVKFLVTGERDPSFLYDGQILICKGLTKEEKYAVRVHEEIHLTTSWQDGEHERYYMLKDFLRIAPIGSLPRK